MWEVAEALVLTSLCKVTPVILHGVVSPEFA